MKTTFRLLSNSLVLALLAVAALLACRPIVAAGGGIQEAAPNAWVKVADAPGPRASFALVYVPGEKAFVCLGGSMQMDPNNDPKAVESPYSELTLNLDKGVWENRLPKGKEAWGPAVGPTPKAPAFPGSYYNFKFKDAEGNVRPYLGAGYYNAMWNWANCAWDSDRGRVVLYWTLANQMAEYDPAARAWEVTASAADMPQSFRDGMLFGSMCYDPVNKEIVGGQGSYAFKDGKWRKMELGSAAINGFRERAEVLRVRARALAGACRARYHLAESAEEAKIDLEKTALEMIRDIQASDHSLGMDVSAAGKAARDHEKTQLHRASEGLLYAAGLLGRAEIALSGQMTVEVIHAADSVGKHFGETVLALSACPPARAHARMVYDPVNKKIILFGGDTLDRLLAETWVYDVTTRQWEQRRPKLSPSPRSGYKLTYLPKAGKVLLIDGYGYKGAGQMWVYDVKADTWQMLADPGADQRRIATRDWFPAPAAASEDDVVVTFASVGGRDDSRRGLETVAARIDASKVDAEATAKFGVPPLTETPYPQETEDPQWFEKNGPAPDPAAEEAVLAKLPANTWVRRDAPNWPKIEYGRSRCWGSCAIDTDRGQLLHFGGGHATYDGNDVLHYSIRANRYYIGFRPEHGLNFAPNGIGIPICQSYQHRPMMSCHTYHAYAYDPTLHKMVFAGTKTEGRNFVFDPLAGDWQLGLTMPFQKNEFSLNFWQTKCTPTPKGVVAWCGQELWRVNAAGATWDKLAVQGKPGAPGWDESGIAYDSKRDRLLLFSSNQKGDVQAVDVQTGKLTSLSPAGRERAIAASREAVYLPEIDGVLLAARPKNSPDGKPRWLLYDCAKNAWLAPRFDGADPLGKEQFNVSLGLMYDPQRKLVWAMDIMSRPHVLRLDLAKADASALAGADAEPPAGKP